MAKIMSYLLYGVKKVIQNHRMNFDCGMTNNQLNNFPTFGDDSWKLLPKSMFFD